MTSTSALRANPRWQRNCTTGSGARSPKCTNTPRRRCTCAERCGSTSPATGREPTRCGSAAELVEIDYLLGQLRDNLPRYEAVLAEAQGRIAADDAALLGLRQQVALGQY